jgi:TDG/mug DNA glycosylase family protein
MLIHSFPPLISAKPAVLILGSMPGRKSLEMSQYYAHPQNQFWRIIGELIGFDPGLPYEKRIQNLSRAGICLWDVLKSCEREGSMDQSIQNSSEIPNDLVGLIRDFPSIQVIAFNGNKAWMSFQKYILPHLEEQTIQRVHLIQMPSTSPANARITFEKKLGSWKKIFNYLH